MKRFVLQSGILALFSLLAVVFATPGQRPAYALGPNIGPSGTTFIVLNYWQESKVKIYEEIQGAPSQTDIKITDTGWTSVCETDPSKCQSYLREGWVVKVGNELMCIHELIDGGYGQPDHMIVQRACGSATSEYHAADSIIYAHTVTVDVFAQNVPGPEGLGGFEVHLTMPPETQYIKAVLDTTWLTSTGRTDPWCDAPLLTAGSWVFRCWTLNRTPNGPTGTGLVARVTVLPPQSLGLTTVSLAGSQIGDLDGTLLNTGVTDIKISTVGCPDANLDGKVMVGDLTLTAKTNGARGEDSLATLTGELNTTDTTIPVGQIGLLQVNDAIAIDAELMTVQAIDPVGPSITVTRASQLTPVRTHAAGAIIYRGTYPNGITGTYNYTWPRDPSHDYKVSVGDITLMAKVSGIFCPAP